MRTDKELIQLVLDNFDSFFSNGMCRTIERMDMANIITFPEYLVLHVLIHRYKKLGILSYLFFDKRRIICSKTYRKTRYFFPKNRIEPRRKYLQYILEKVS